MASKTGSVIHFQKTDTIFIEQPYLPNTTLSVTPVDKERPAFLQGKTTPESAKIRSSPRSFARSRKPLEAPEGTARNPERTTTSLAGGGF